MLQSPASSDSSSDGSSPQTPLAPWADDFADRRRFAIERANMADPGAVGQDCFTNGLLPPVVDVDVPLSEPMLLFDAKHTGDPNGFSGSYVGSLQLDFGCHTSFDAFPSLLAFPGPGEFTYGMPPLPESVMDDMFGMFINADACEVEGGDHDS